MKNLFHRLGKGRRKWHLKNADLGEVAEDFPNPARGWYQIHTFRAAEEPDFDELEWCLDKKDTLVFVLIDIGDFRDRDLDGEVLGRIGRILDFFARRQYDCIVRVVYDHEGRAMEKEPFFFAQVLAHLRQLCGILTQYAQSVFVYQGMLVGNWGEMHTSRFLHGDKLVQMAEVLRTCIGGKIYLAVRQPVYWRMLHDCRGEEELASLDGMGLFDDGMFGSPSHLGTFGTQPRQDVPWDVPWDRADELAFENKLCKYVPNGGEAVYGDGFVEKLTPERVITDLRQMQITYLNRIYDAKILEIWKQWKYPGQGAWADKSIYEFIGAHLGYRFVVRKVLAMYQKRSGKCLVEVEVENVGFGGFYQEAELYLESMDDQGQHHLGETIYQIKGWASGEKRQFAYVVNVCSCELFLAAKRKWDGARIHFANFSDQEGRAVLGRLCME